MRKLLSLLAVLVSFIVPAIAQTRTITGKVTDQQGSPVQFASIRIKGTKTGTTADADGNFVIKAAIGQTLILSGMGMTSKDVPIVNEAPLNIQVTRAQSNLTEVVVTALGIRRQPKQLGYSTAIITSKEINEASVTNLANGLSAKIAGVDIRLEDNSVNPNIKITFRGSRSIAGDNTALIVLDGIIVPQSYLTGLNTEDIDNVTILKGPNAAALYGKDASNGVMILTTKKGKKGHLAINYKNSTMFNKVSYMPNLQNEYSPNGGEPNYIDPLTGMPLPVPFENQNFGPAYDSRDFPYTQIAIGGPDSTGKITYGPYKAYPNGRKDFFRTGVLEQNDLSVSDANSWGSFFVSGQHVVNNGVVYNDKSTRNTGRFNGTLKFGNFSAAGGVGYSHTDVNQAGLGYSGGTQYRPVYWSVINQPPNIDLKTVKNVDGSYIDGPSGYINQYYTNPWYQVFHSRTIQKTNFLTSNLQLDYKFTPWLAVTVRGGYNKTTRNAPSQIDAYTYSTTAQGDPWGAGGTVVAAPTLPLQLELVKIDFDDNNNDAFVTVRRKVSLFDVTLVAGGNYRQQTSHGYWYSNQATSTLAVPNSITKVTNTDGSAYANYHYKSNSQSVYGDLTVGYDNWAFLHASYRNDWLSILSPQTRRFSYEGADVSLVLSDKFPSLVSDKGLSYLKIRGGYSITGNISIPNTTNLGFLAGGTTLGLSMPTFGAYGIYPGVTVGSGYPYGSLNGYSLSYNSVQPLLKPERDASTEVGFELGLLKDRIRIEASYYAIGVTNQTVNSQVSGATGTSTLLLNTGKIQDNGYEFDLKLTPLLALGKFSWNIGANLSLVNNKVIYLKKGDTSTTKLILASSGSTYNIDAVPGKDYLSLYVQDWNRDPEGRVIVDGKTGLPSTNSSLVYAGNTNYKYRLGLTSGMTYKGFSLNAVFDYRGGAKMFNSMGQALDFAGISATSGQNRQHFIVPNSVIYDGTKYVPNTSVPTTGTAAQWWSTTYNAIGTPYVVSAAFWKLRELSLGYDIPVTALGLQKVVRRINFSLIAQNLFMWRPKTNQWTDPEFSTSANANANAVGVASEYVTPPLRSFGFSLNVNF
ncbi:MAG TPA: SusC/RagA family TonB-linked outer membrane protein [Puia sp.]|nr:SusC/RagA family TonB-linked outer membrane protein [Puia sp.]